MSSECVASSTAHAVRCNLSCKVRLSNSDQSTNVMCTANPLANAGHRVIIARRSTRAIARRVMTEGRYSDALNQEGRNLSRMALDKKISLPVYREQQVAAVVGSIKRGRSVMMVGETGVGKTAILHGVAAELPRIARELWELPSMSFLTGTRYLGDWQSKAESVLEALKSRRGVLSLTDVWNVLTVGTSANDPSSLFDFLRPKM